MNKNNKKKYFSFLMSCLKKLFFHKKVYFFLLYINTSHNPNNVLYQTPNKPSPPPGDAPNLQDLGVQPPPSRGVAPRNDIQCPESHGGRARACPPCAPHSRTATAGAVFMSSLFRVH